MKIMETATFKFRFKESKSKAESYAILQKFLTDNNWLDGNGNKRPPLKSYHSDNSGECEIILADETSSDDYIDFVEELFESIVEINDILYVKTYYNQNTFNIVHKEAGKYLNKQTVDLSAMKNGDEICVFYSRKRN